MCPRLSHAHERGDEAAITNPKPLKPIDGIALLFTVHSLLHAELCIYLHRKDIETSETKQYPANLKNRLNNMP